MNDLTKKLLAPIQADLPCGPDLAYDPALADLLTLASGKPEIEIGTVVKPAEPPEWPVLREACRKFLERSRHLNVAVIYACCLLKLEGVEGFREGMELIQGLLENYWAGLYPALDPEDNNDPTQRLNLLRPLTAAAGVVDGWIKFVDYLPAAPLVRPKGAEPVTFEMALLAQGRGAEEAAKLATLINSQREAAARNQEALAAALAAVDGVDQFLTNTLGSGGSVSFENLVATLRSMLRGVEFYLSGGTTAPVENGGGEPGNLPSSGGVTGGAAVVVQGPIRTRAEVVQALESICHYYAQMEPGSPVPFLLRRAQKMVHMNFLEAVQELSIASADTLRPSMGSALDGLAGGTPPAE